MLLMIWIYTRIWGWQFALGFVLLLLVHETGHLLVAKKFGLMSVRPFLFRLWVRSSHSRKRHAMRGWKHASVLAARCWGVLARWFARRYLERDRRRIELMNYLLLSMPGTPVIYYGGYEIGMGDNIHLGDRNGARARRCNGHPTEDISSPFPDPDLAAGAADGDGSAVRLPDGQCGIPGIGSAFVAHVDAAHDRGSAPYNGVRPRQLPAALSEETGRSWRIFAKMTKPPILCVANLSRTPQAVELDLSDFQGRLPIELDGHSQFPPIGQLTYLLTLPPYGFYWFLLSKPTSGRPRHTPAPEPMPEYQTIVHAPRVARGDPGRAHRDRARDTAVLSGQAPLVRHEGSGAAVSPHRSC